MAPDTISVRGDAASAVLDEGRLNGRVQALRKCPIFYHLSESEIYQLAAQMAEQRLVKGAILFAEGDPWCGPYLVAAGAIQAFRMAPDGRRQVVSMNGTGDLIALTSDYGGEPDDSQAGYQVSTVRALCASVVYHIPREAFLDLISAHPEVALHILRLLGQRLRFAWNLVADLSFQRAPQRVAAVLVWLARNYGTPGERGIGLDLTLSRLEMAEAAGTSTETVIRNLRKFQKAGLVELRKRRIHVLDLEELARLAEQPSVVDDPSRGISPDSGCGLRKN